jgi:hypothetical protein
MGVSGDTPIAARIVAEISACRSKKNRLPVHLVVRQPA